MRDINQHFGLIEKAIEYSVATEIELEAERFDAAGGSVIGVLYFADGSRLEFSEQVVIEKGRPIKLKYRYQFVRGDVTIFRYDNAPHHEHVATHPHHKHVGSNIIPAIEPEFKQVLEEAAASLREATAQPTKKRRSNNPRKGKQ